MDSVLQPNRVVLLVHDDLVADKQDRLKTYFNLLKCYKMCAAFIQRSGRGGIWYYSLHGHVEIMAREIQRGANSVQGVEATLWQVPETLSNTILNKVKANPKPDDVPVILPEQLLEADGFLFGFPSRFGVMAYQFKAFFDATHELWATQALAGKPAGFFWSTGFFGGGQELAAFTAITQLAHHGMLFVPLGYTFGSGMFEMGEVKGGSSYGAGTFAADGSRQPTELELQQAFYQGKYVAEITKKLKG